MPGRSLGLVLFKVRVSEHARLREYGDVYVMAGESTTAAGHKGRIDHRHLTRVPSIGLLDYCIYASGPASLAIIVSASFAAESKCCTPEQRERGSLQRHYTYCCMYQVRGKPRVTRSRMMPNYGLSSSRILTPCGARGNRPLENRSAWYS